MKLKLTKKEFKKFLEDYPKSTVGRARKETSCPIATYLKTKYKNKNIKVIPYFNGRGIVTIGDTEYTLKKWQNAFGYNIDNHYANSSKVSKSVALKELSEL